MSFSLQGSQIRASLVAAGVPADAATTIANVLSNAAQTMRHAGEMQVDRTPRDLRMVTPEARKHSLRNLDFRAGDPDHRPPQTNVRSSEARRSPEPEPAVLSDRAPQRDDSPFRVAGGAYTETQTQGDAVRVDLRVRGGGDCAFIEPRSNTLVGKTLRAEAGGGEAGRIRFAIEHTDREAVWKLSLLNVRTERVVSDVRYEPGRGLVVTYRDVETWSYSEPVSEVLPMAQAQLVSGVTLDAQGITVTSSVVDVFAAAAGPAGLIPVSDCSRPVA